MTSPRRFIGLAVIAAGLALALLAPVLHGLVAESGRQPPRAATVAPYTFDGARIVMR